MECRVSGQHKSHRVLRFFKFIESIFTLVLCRLTKSVSCQNFKCGKKTCTMSSQKHLLKVVFWTVDWYVRTMMMTKMMGGRNVARGSLNHSDGGKL
jgi:hypothetical protein